MPRYDKIFSILAKRAVEHGTIDATAFMKMRSGAGVSLELLAEQLEDDLHNDGPIFGKFVRSLEGAAASATMAARRQGEMVGQFAAARDRAKARAGR